jgi:UDP-glucose 4-epimerase
VDVVGTHRQDTDFLAPLRGLQRLNLVRGDLVDAASLPGPFDAIVHTAATSPGPGIGVAHFVRDNVDAAFALIEAARRWEVRCFVFFSSLSLHGRIDQDVVTERTPVHDPDPYGASKLIVEQRLAELADELPTLALRLPAILGIGAHRHWLSRVAAQLRAGQPVQAFHLDRPFNNATHIDNVAALVTNLLFGAAWQGFDAAVLGATGPMTVREVINGLAQAVGVVATIKEVPARIPSFTLSSAHAVTCYDYRPPEIDTLIERYGCEVCTSRSSSIRRTPAECDLRSGRAATSHRFSPYQLAKEPAASRKTRA